MYNEPHDEVLLNIANAVAGIHYWVTQIFVYKEQIELMNFVCTCKSIILFLLFIAMAQLFVQQIDICNGLMPMMPSPHCTIYVEFNEGVIMT